MIKSKDLVDSKELISHFSGLRDLCSLIDLGSLRNLKGLDDLKSPFSPKNFLNLMISSPLGTQMTNTCPFLGIGTFKNPNFY